MSNAKEALEAFKGTYAVAMRAMANLCRDTTTRFSNRSIGPRCVWCDAFDKKAKACTISGKKEGKSDEEDRSLFAA